MLTLPSEVLFHFQVEVMPSWCHPSSLSQPTYQHGIRTYDPKITDRDGLSIRPWQTNRDDQVFLSDDRYSAFPPPAWKLMGVTFHLLPTKSPSKPVEFRSTTVKIFPVFLVRTFRYILWRRSCLLCQLIHCLSKNCKQLSSVISTTLIVCSTLHVGWPSQHNTSQSQAT